MMPLDPPDDDPDGERAQIEAEEQIADEMRHRADVSGENDEDDERIAR